MAVATFYSGAECPSQNSQLPCFFGRYEGESHYTFWRKVGEFGLAGDLVGCSRSRPDVPSRQHPKHPAECRMLQSQEHHQVLS